MVGASGGPLYMLCGWTRTRPRTRMGGGGALSFISGVARGVRARANKIDPFSRH